MRQSDWYEIHTLMRRSDWCEQHATLYANIVFFNTKKISKTIKFDGNLGKIHLLVTSDINNHFIDIGTRWQMKFTLKTLNQTSMLDKFFLKDL